MAQYYQFINRTRHEVSQISLPFNFGLPHAKSIERYDSREVTAMFRYVAQHNADWTVEDSLVAEGDYGEVVQYDRTQQPEQTYAWEVYTPEPKPPQPL
ncbi:MAG: hypothetical protein AAF810_02325 [Cyanobacteria bacterium P01_D01_bin.36]